MSDLPVAPIAERADAPEALEIPPAHLELRWRSLTSGDVSTLVALVQAMEAVDNPCYRTTPEEVANWFVGEWRDPARNSLGGFDNTGALRAYGFAELRPGDETALRVFLTGGVHPGWRGRGIGMALVGWVEGRGRQLLVESGKNLPARLAVYLEEGAREQRRLYAAAGFSPKRWYTDMRRDLRVPIPRVDLAPGLTIVPWSADLDDPVRLACNEAFADHWGSQPQTPETWADGRQDFIPGWSFVALDLSGGAGGAGAGPQVAGFVLSSRHEQDWPILGYTCGYVDRVGVRRPWRGKRVAVALLSAAMRAYRAEGLQFATLSVDTENPTGAHGLYADLGFEPTHGVVLYTIEL